ncbi:MAG: DUF932 domain-containing protein [Alistipes sp.]|nr:DUF932 domain-containing protein [Alistipes sp.]
MNNQNALINGNMKTFMFDAKTRIAELDLPTLRRTSDANNPYGKPLRGVYHYKAIENIEDMCRKLNLSYEIEEIFAAQNNNKNLPGVIVLPELEEKYGKDAVEAHILNRIYTTFRIDDGQDNETTTTLALAYHQDGIQAAIGPCVKICHNQCILSPERMVSDYGKNKVPFEHLFVIIESWLNNFSNHRAEDLTKIRALKSAVLSKKDVIRFIGLLTSIRVAQDSKDKGISFNLENYPLNQSQITIVAESLLIKMKDREEITAWEVYNAATELYKPGRCEIPNLFLQNISMVETLIGFCSGRL